MINVWASCLWLWYQEASLLGQIWWQFGYLGALGQALTRGSTRHWQFGYLGALGFQAAHSGD